VLLLTKLTDKSEVKRVFDEHNYEDLIDEIRELRRKLYFKKENIEYLIESFDKYFNLEDRNVSTGKKVMFLKMTKIKDLPKFRRPREKLFEKGADALKDYELLAILLRTGYQGKSAIEIAKRILKEKPFKNPGTTDFNTLIGILREEEATATIEGSMKIIQICNHIIKN